MVTNDSGTSSKPPKPVKVLAESEGNLEKVEEEGVMMSISCSHKISYSCKSYNLSY